MGVCDTHGKYATQQVFLEKITTVSEIIGTDSNFTSILGENSSNKKDKKVNKSLASNSDSSEWEQESSSNNSDNGNNFVDFKQYPFLRGLIFVKQLCLGIFYELHKKLNTNRKQKQ